MTKVAHMMPAENIRQAVAKMPLDQFTAYENAIRSQPYESFSTNPDLLTALQAVNERRAAEGRGLNITVRDGISAGIPWVPLIAIAAVLLIASRL